MCRLANNLSLPDSFKRFRRGLFQMRSSVIARPSILVVIIAAHFDSAGWRYLVDGFHGVIAIYPPCSKQSPYPRLLGF